MATLAAFCTNLTLPACHSAPISESLDRARTLTALSNTASMISRYGGCSHVSWAPHSFPLVGNFQILQAALMGFQASLPCCRMNCCQAEIRLQPPDITHGTDMHIKRYLSWAPMEHQQGGHVLDCHDVDGLKRVHSNQVAEYNGLTVCACCLFLDGHEDVSASRIKSKTQVSIYSCQVNDHLHCPLILLVTGATACWLSSSKGTPLLKISLQGNARSETPWMLP